MTNATDFRRETEALLVGEPVVHGPAATRKCLVHVAQLQLRLSVASLDYRFQDSEAPTVMPDRAVTIGWAAYKAGRDPVMEWILRNRAKQGRGQEHGQRPKTGSEATSP